MVSTRTLCWATCLQRSRKPSDTDTDSDSPGGVFVALFHTQNAAGFEMKVSNGGYRMGDFPVYPGTAVRKTCVSLVARCT